MAWILGIDGGGSNTTALAADESGNILGYIQHHSANYHIIGINQFQKVIGEIVGMIAAAAGLPKLELQVVSLGLAGVDREGDRERVLTALEKLNLGCHYIVNNDAAIALTAGLGNAEGVVLIAGTGSIAYGINGQGQIYRAGGWGHILGDEGSGYDIGHQALVRGLKANEGRDKPSMLLAGILAKLHIASLDELVTYIYSTAADKGIIASLAEVVTTGAEQGDEVSREILDRAALNLAALVESVIWQGFAHKERVQVCTFGGVLKNSPLLCQLVAEQLSARAQWVAATKEPVSGALQLGLDFFAAQKAKME
jgi:N-acetylglucosamine kinase-like BadF-type ATPase